MNQKNKGWILLLFGLLLFSSLFLIGFSIFYAIPLMVIFIGIIFVITYKTTNEVTATVQPNLSSQNTETNEGSISHDSEEYRRWKEGK